MEIASVRTNKIISDNFIFKFDQINSANLQMSQFSKTVKMNILISTFHFRLYISV